MLCNAKIRFAPAAVTGVTLAKQSNNNNNNNNNNDNDMKGPSTVTTDDSPSSEQKHNERLPLPPSSSSSSSSSSSGGSAWQQFLHYHHLAPCRILVAGASGSGKSALAKELAKEYELQYVDVLDTLRWVASSNNSSNSSSSGGDETSSSSSSSAATATVAASAAAADVKKALLDIMTAKLQEGVKKGAPPVICDPLTFDYTESLVALVPLPLVRKSLALRISTCPHCKIKGFVLDVWHVSDLVGDVNDFVELLNLNNNKDSNNHNSFQLSGSDPASMVVTGGETETGPLSELGTTAKVETDVIVVELDSGDKVGGAPPSSMCPPCAHVQSYLSIPLTPSLSHLLTSPLSPLLISPPPPSHTPPPSHHPCSHPSPKGPSSGPVYQVFGSLGIG